MVAIGDVRRLDPGDRACRPTANAAAASLAATGAAANFANTAAPAPAEAPLPPKPGSSWASESRSDTRQRQHTESRARRAELVLQALAAAEDDRLDRRARQPQRRADLGVGEAVELAQHDRVALLGRQVGKRRAEGLDLIVAIDLTLQLVADGLADERQRLGSAGSQPGPALVPRDRSEPGGRLTRLLPAEQRPVGREEGLLRRILGLDRVAQHQAADAVDEAAVLFEERGEPLSGRPLVAAAGERERADAASRRRRPPPPPPSPSSSRLSRVSVSVPWTFSQRISTRSCSLKPERSTPFGTAHVTGKASCGLDGDRPAAELHQLAAHPDSTVVFVVCRSRRPSGRGRA